MEEEGEEISESLTADFTEIRNRFNEVTEKNRGFTEKFEKELFIRCSQFREKLTQTNEKYSENQAQFYKAMKQIFKKVKQ